MAKILIVDDDFQTRQLFVSLLSPFGHHVMETRDGRVGLEQARLRKPDLIISDILMPTMNGYEFVSTLRKYPSLENVPVIFHSATFMEPQTRSLGAACGVSLFIAKPCEPEAALATVQKALGLEIQKPTALAPTHVSGDPIPLVIDAFFEKGKELDAVSVRLASLLELALDAAPHSSAGYFFWTRSRQEQIEADLKAAWSNDPVIGEVHGGYTGKCGARTSLFSKRRIGRGGGDRNCIPNH
jgi:CheY-like chemotaxis protein